MATFNRWNWPPDSQPESLVQLHSPVVNLQILNRTRRAPPNYDASLLMCLPPEIHRMLFDYLDDYDRLCLLLTCKYFARASSTINEDKHYIPIGPKLLRINQGFSNRMPKRLSLCVKCGVMRPKDSTYWEPHRCGWDWRKLILTKDHRSFADKVHAWGRGWSTKCPRCFGTFIAQGNLKIGELPCYGNTIRKPAIGGPEY